MLLLTLPQWGKGYSCSLSVGGCKRCTQRGDQETFCWEHNLKPHQAFYICLLDKLTKILLLIIVSLAWMWDTRPYQSFLNHPSSLSCKFIPAWWIGRISLASNARTGILLYCVVLYFLSLGLFSLFSFIIIFLILDTLNSPGSSERRGLRGR